MFGELPDSDDNYDELRAKLDVAEASDLFFWASARPWWSIEMIEEGSYALLEVIENLSSASKKQKKNARELYNEILSKAFEWKRSGRIYKMRKERDEAVRIPFKERTLEVGGEEVGVYEAFVDMMKDLEKKAAEEGDYEEAIIWRDSLYKIDKKTDIYDSVHAVDLLRTRIPNQEVEELIEKYKDKYRHIRGGQPEQRE